jgi:hypothetical protein
VKEKRTRDNNRLSGFAKYRLAIVPARRALSKSRSRLLAGDRRADGQGIRRSPGSGESDGAALRRKRARAVDALRSQNDDEADNSVFSSAVSPARFSADGKRLFVLTANQTAYVLNLFEKES